LPKFSTVCGAEFEKLGSGTGPIIRYAHGWFVEASRVGNGSLVELLLLVIRSRYSFTRPVGFRHHENQCGLGDHLALVFALIRECFTVPPSDCLPDVRQQFLDCVEVAASVRVNVRVSNAH
jgi:hypothetical protein